MLLHTSCYPNFMFKICRNTVAIDTWVFMLLTIEIYISAVLNGDPRREGGKCILDVD